MKVRHGKPWSLAEDERLRQLVAVHVLKERCPTCGQLPRVRAAEGELSPWLTRWGPVGRALDRGPGACQSRWYMLVNVDKHLAARTP